jgi:hypothetical protein
MKHDSRYIQNELKFLQYSKEAVGHCFVSPSDFERFYSLISNNEAKNEFLRVASFYLFLVKKGDWVTGQDTVTDYLTNSYKLVGLFSLIESLAEREHQEFFRWLCSSSKTNNIFPIDSKSGLEALFDNYNRAHGKTNFCVNFFEKLPEEQQAELMRGIQVRGRSVSTTKRAVKTLYGLRSRFVHEGNLLVQLSDSPALTTIKKKSYLFGISISKVTELFEHALLLHFAAKHNITLQRTVKSYAFAVR